MIVKKYDTGKVTPKIFALNVGDKLEFQGAFTKLEYKPNMKKEIGMIAGGTGITPMLQVPLLLLLLFPSSSLFLLLLLLLLLF